MERKKSLKKRKGISLIIIIIAIAITLVALIWAAVGSIKDNEIAELPTNETVEQNIEKQEFVEVLADKTRLNVSSKLQEVKKFAEFEISELQITEKNNVTLLLGTITNVSQSKQGGYPINITMKDKEGNEIITIAAYIGELKPGESTQLSTSATFDYVNVYDFSISKRQ